MLKLFLNLNRRLSTRKYTLKFCNLVVFFTKISRMLFFITDVSNIVISVKPTIKTLQKQPSIDVLRKRCSENMQQIYRRILMPKCNFNKVALALWHRCSLVNLLHIFRTPFPKNISERLLLNIANL